MLDRLITFALKERVCVLAIALAVAISGWYAWKNLPVEAFPDVQDVQVQIITQVPGQAPEEVERSVSLPIELQMSGVPRLTNLRSVSITGLSVVTLTFSDGTNDYFARQQVLERLVDVNLPPNINATVAPLTNAVGEIYRYIVEAPPDMPLYEVRALQDVDGVDLQDPGALDGAHQSAHRRRIVRPVAEPLRGQGDAEKNRIFAEAFGQDPDFFAFYRSMQAYETAFKPGETRFLVSPRSDFFRYFSTPDGGASTAAATLPESHDKK